METIVHLDLSLKIMKLDQFYQNKCYFPDDVFGFIRNTPYRFIMGKGIFWFIKKIEQKCLDHKEILHLYPQVKCEYLEEVYNLHKILSTRNEQLIFELFESTWRGEIIAALIILFFPDSKFEDKLINCFKSQPQNKVLELAKVGLYTRSDELFQKIDNIKSHLEKLEKQPFVIRANITEKYGKRFVEEHKMILETYKEKGLKEARIKLKGTLFAYFFVKTFEDIQKKNKQQI